MDMSPSRPYLLRAVQEWILDNDMTPYIMVTVGENVTVPTEHIKDGSIILNISPSATSGLLLDNEAVSFSARFSGSSRQVYIPINFITAIYARENGKGMFFGEPYDGDDEHRQGSGPISTDKKSSPKGSHLKVIK